MAIKIVLAAISAANLILFLCVVSLNTRLRFAEKFMDERYKKAYKNIVGKSGDAADGKEDV